MTHRGLTTKGLEIAEWPCHYPRETLKLESVPDPFETLVECPRLTRLRLDRHCGAESSAGVSVFR
jgi:hypothetical protein